MHTYTPYTHTKIHTNTYHIHRDTDMHAYTQTKIHKYPKYTLKCYVYLDSFQKDSTGHADQRELSVVEPYGNRV